ncbi:MAG: metallophosphoesterase [Lachnospiraceae bacterium]|nr:metallophosphoesterase [Lachnospiraceae bacterium]
MIRLSMETDRDIRILNLTDPQLTAGEWEKGNRTGDAFRYTVGTLIERVRPDLITVSGDLSYAGDYVSYRNYADYFDDLGIPWTCCFGNHDNQGGDEPVRRVLDEFMKRKTFVFEKCDPALGNSNFVILIEKNGKAAEGIILMDTHDRIPYKADMCGKNEAWAGLTPEQLAWYRDRIAELKEAGCRDSTLIIHTPIYAYIEAAGAAFVNPVPEKGEPDYGFAGWNPGYEDSFGFYHEIISAYPEDEGAFELIHRLGSTGNVISGHDHMNNWAVRYRGVRLIFGTKTGIGSYGESAINGGTVLTVDENGVKDVRHEYVDLDGLR